MRKIITRACRDLGYDQILDAEDGIDGWNILHENCDVGLVISDLGTATSGGLELLRRMRADERFKSLPFMLLTATSGADKVKEALVAGVDSYTVKPFTPKSLLKGMESAFKKRPPKA